MDTVKTKIKKQILKETNYEKIWSVNDFKKYPQMSVLKAFSDLYKENFIKRAKRGFYYRVKNTILGETSYNEIDLAISKVKKRCKFYCLSGIAGYNELGFTTQIPNNIVIACDSNIRSEKNIRYIYRKKPIDGGVAERIVLDAIIDIKIIPDTTIEKTIDRIKYLIEKDTVSLSSLVKTAFSESPRVKSIIGAIAEEFNYDLNVLKELKSSLNPLSMIYLNVGNTLNFANNWQIKPER